LLGTENVQRQEEPDELSADPLFAPWPEPGKGLYSRLPPEPTDTKHLADDDDFESFSVLLFSDHGRKVMENGMAV